jgi:hypothetical protein
MVKRIKGTEGSAADICCAVSMPVMSGIDKSNKTTSGFSFWNFSTPVRPSSASPQMVQWRERNIVPTTRRVVSESSTINIRSAFGSILNTLKEVLAFYAFSQIDAVRKQANDKSGYYHSKDNYEVHSFKKVELPRATREYRVCWMKP